MGDRRTDRAPVSRPASVARMAIWSAVISLVTFVAGVAFLTYSSKDTRAATCDLVRAQINAYAADPPEPGTRAADLAAAWVHFGQRQGCIR